MLDNLIFDRTQNDVNYALQLRDAGVNVLGDLKGVYNISDRNRVGAAMEYVYGLLRGMAYYISITAKTDWQLTDFATPALNEQMRGGIERMKNTFVVFPDTPDIPATLDMITFEDANALEKILFDLETMALLAARSFKPCGTFAAGQTSLLPRRVN